MAQDFNGFSVEIQLVDANRPCVRVHQRVRGETVDREAGQRAACALGLDEAERVVEVVGRVLAALEVQQGRCREYLPVDRVLHDPLYVAGVRLGA